jgi:hypothetical protein
VAATEDDRAFLAAFESCALPGEAFHHRDHVRVAWLYLRELPAAAALERFASGLRRFAATHGHPGLYHETITWAYLVLIRERMARSADLTPGDTFEDFAAAHPDLLTWKPSILDRYYRQETLGSELARRVFLLPDRGNDGGDRGGNLPPSPAYPPRGQPGEDVPGE